MSRTLTALLFAVVVSCGLCVATLRRDSQLEQRIGLLETQAREQRERVGDLDVELHFANVRSSRALGQIAMLLNNSTMLRKAVRLLAIYSGAPRGNHPGEVNLNLYSTEDILKAE